KGVSRIITITFLQSGTLLIAQLDFDKSAHRADTLAYFCQSTYHPLCNIIPARSCYQTLRAIKRRQRKADPLASPAAVHSITEKLRSVLPDLIPHKDKELVRLLRAARHAQRYPATDTKRGRPSKWKREDLLRVASRLGDIIDRETSSHGLVFKLRRLLP